MIIRTYLVRVEGCRRKIRHDVYNDQRTIGEIYIGTVWPGRTPQKRAYRVCKLVDERIVV